MADGAPRRRLARIALPAAAALLAAVTVVLALVVVQQARLLRGGRLLDARIGAVEQQLAAAGSARARPQPARGIPGLPSSPVPMAELVADQPAYGNPDAPVTIVEFSDFECPFCRRFFHETLPAIHRRYVDTGQVRLVFRDFPLDDIHPRARKAAEAAGCARDQDRFWEMHGLLFSRGAGGGVPQYRALAAELGLNRARFDECLDSGRKAAQVQADYEAGLAAGVRGTPAFVVNGALIAGSQPLEVFEQVIGAALELRAQATNTR
jgi:protein-disulfide isomerase